MGIFGWHALIAFAGSVIYALFMIVTRMLRGTPDTIMAAWQIWTALLFGIASVVVGHWTPIASGFGTVLPALRCSGWSRSGAIVCVNRSLAYAPASVVVPYQYTTDRLGDRLRLCLLRRACRNVLTLIGAAIIIGAGLFIYFRERKVQGEMSSDVVPGP